MKRLSVALVTVATFCLAACANDDTGSQNTNEQRACSPRGVACVADCPPAGKLTSGAPCQQGTWDATRCSCDPLVAPTCGEVGGRCGALTATGVLCDPGYVVDEQAGSCAVGGGCCVLDRNVCPPTGTACTLDCPAAGKLPSGAPCQYGSWNPTSCNCEQPTCADAGGRCAPLSAAGVRCEAGYAEAADAGSCAIGATCCMPS